MLPSKSPAAPAGLLESLLGPCEPGRWSVRTCPCSADIVLSFRRRKATKRSPTSAGCLNTLYDEERRRRPSSHLLVTVAVALAVGISSLSRPPGPSDVTVRIPAALCWLLSGAFICCLLLKTLHHYHFRFDIIALLVAC
mmetsp:Transcript_1524/g.3159  ORF Transcript_1524/g.3159 Transcript_1524/m.3159 type:complete len:139 (-) Transcript_1524:65-481(-)